MDFHKLQKTLNDIEPSDRASDIEKLRRAAQGNNSPEPREQISESSAPVQATVLNEAEQFAALAGITPSKKAAPINDEASEMAALAGIQLDEKQKMGRAGQARGSDPWPEVSKPSKDGEQPHPLKDKLVGDSYEEGDVDVEQATEETGGLPHGVSKALAPYATALSNILRNPELNKEFKELMKVADPKIHLEAYRESKASKSDKDSIKEQLLRRLNSKK